MITCIAIDDEPLARAYLEDFIKKTGSLKLLASFGSAAKAWEFLGRQTVDVVFSDIAMPDMSGISFLKTLKNPPIFVFVTANPEHAVESYELDVMDFIVKPYDYGRFLRAVSKIQAFLQKDKGTQEASAFVTVKDGHHNVILRTDEIYYLKGEKEYTRMFTEGNKEHLVHKTLGNLETLLPKERFLRVQKSYIVNIDYVRSVTPSTISMKGSLPDIPLGTQYRQEVFKRFGIG
jgi:Response regulator of the LytR/AlgR family